MRLRTGAVLGATALLLAACSSDPASPPSSSAPGTTSPRSSAPSTSAVPSTTTTRAPQPTRPTVVADDLEVPWGLAFLPDGSALVSERDSHRIVHLTRDGDEWDSDAVGTVPGVGGGGEGGLLGLALSPSFSRDRTGYVYFSTDTDNRVARFRFDGERVSGFTPIRTGIPSANIHNGGRIAFGPDGYLWVTAGDASQSDRAPDAGYLGGKVLRMTAQGRPAPGNPDPDSVVYTRGHRNPQGLAFAPGGAVYEAEFGQNAQDEINLLRAGADYGWPTVEGTNGQAAGKTAPLLTFPTSDASPSGLAYAGGALWLAALGGEKLYRIPVTGSGLGRPQVMLDGTYGRLRTVVAAPDGSLWVTTSNRDGRGEPRDGDDKIIRVPVTAS